MPASLCLSILCCVENICGEFYAWTTTIHGGSRLHTSPATNHGNKLFGLMSILTMTAPGFVWLNYLVRVVFLPSFPWAGRHHGRKIQKLFSSLFLPLLSRPHGVFCSSCWTYLKSNLKCLATVLLPTQGNWIYSRWKCSKSLTFQPKHCTYFPYSFCFRLGKKLVSWDSKGDLFGVINSHFLQASSIFSIARRKSFVSLVTYSIDIGHSRTCSTSLAVYSVHRTAQ